MMKRIITLLLLLSGVSVSAAAGARIANHRQVLF